MVFVFSSLPQRPTTPQPQASALKGVMDTAIFPHPPFPWNQRDKSKTKLRGNMTELTGNTVTAKAQKQVFLVKRVISQPITEAPIPIRVMSLCCSSVYAHGIGNLKGPLSDRATLK